MTDLVIVTDSVLLHLKKSLNSNIQNVLMLFFFNAEFITGKNHICPLLLKHLIILPNCLTINYFDMPIFS